MRALAACAAPAATSRRGAVRRARPRYARRGASRCSTARVRASGPDAPSPGPPATVHLVGAGPGGLDTLTVKALRLMGADGIISGIGPQIAQTMVQLGVDLGTIETKATLADALTTALRAAGARIEKRQNG